MMAGTLEIWLDELECHTLSEGTASGSRAPSATAGYNPSSVDTVMIWINTPPTF